MKFLTINTASFVVNNGDSTMNAPDYSDDISPLIEQADCIVFSTDPLSKKARDSQSSIFHEAIIKGKIILGVSSGAIYVHRKNNGRLSRGKILVSDKSLVLSHDCETGSITYHRTRCICCPSVLLDNRQLPGLLRRAIEALQGR